LGRFFYPAAAADLLDRLLALLFECWLDGELLLLPCELVLTLTF